MTEHLRRAGQVSWAVVGIAALVAVVGLVCWTVRVIFPPLVLAGAVVFLLNPVVSRLNRRGVPRPAATGLAYLGVAGVVGLLGLLVVPLAIDQGEQLADDWPEIEAKAERWIDERAEESRGTFWEFTRQELEDAFSRDNRSFREQLDRLVAVGEQVFHVLLVVILTPIIAFYMLADLPRVRRSMEALVPPGAHDEVMYLCRRLNRTIGGFFRGQLLVALIVGVLCSLGLAAIGLKFWFLVGMIAGLFNIIPLIGPWVGGIPGLLIAVTTGSALQALGVVIVMVAVQQIDNHFITPQVMHRTVQLHPAAVILALLAGGTVAGFMGLLFAVPAVAMLKIVLGHLWRVHVLGQPIPGAEPPEPPPPEDEEAAEQAEMSPAELATDGSRDQESSRSTTSATPSP